MKTIPSASAHGLTKIAQDLMITLQGQEDSSQDSACKSFILATSGASKVSPVALLSEQH